MPVSQMKNSVALAVLALGVGCGGVAYAENWEGFYGGLFAGRAMGDATFTPVGSPNAYGTDSTDATVGGAFVGYNFQRGNLVFGPELLVSGAGGDNSVFTHGCNCSSVAFSLNSTIELGGRVGWTRDKSLFYASAGVADVSYDMRFTANGAPTPLNFDLSDTVPYLGLGFEQALKNGWSIRGEYRHYFDLKTSTPNTPFPGSLVTLSAGTQDYDLGIATIAVVKRF